jgi:hypothetical protein
MLLARSKRERRINTQEDENSMSTLGFVSHLRD